MTLCFVSSKIGWRRKKMHILSGAIKCIRKANASDGKQTKKSSCLPGFGKMG